VTPWTSCAARRPRAEPTLRRSLSLAALIVAAAPWNGFAVGQTPASAGPLEAVRYVLDVSSSMRARFGHGTKLDAARALLLSLDRDLERRGAAPRPSLWVYGARTPRRARDCSDVRLLAHGRGQPLERLLAGLAPTGVSPLLRALDEVATGGDASSEAWVVFTDGSDNCGRDPCTWALSPAARPRIYVIGFGLDEQDERALRCLTEDRSGYLVNLQPESDWQPEMTRLAAVLQNRGLLRVDALLAGRPVTLQGRLFRTGATEAVRLRTGRPEELPAGMYRVIIETLPPAVFERVLVLPGGERQLVIDDLAELRLQAYDAVNTPLPAYASLVPDTSGGAETYVSGAQPLYVRAGRYRLTVEVEDSVALRRTLELGPGELRTVHVGGLGYVAARAPGLSDLGGIPVELHDYATGEATLVEPWRDAAPVPAGEYRAVVRSLPRYVQESFTVAPAETSALVVPSLGTLVVEAADAAGRPLSVPVTLLRPQSPGAGEESPTAILGTFLTGERQAVLAGSYDLLVETTPPVVERNVRVEPGAARVVALPAGGGEGGGT
jgi:hypothetical protein